MAFDAFFPHITLSSGQTDKRKGDGIGMIINGKCMMIDAFDGGEATTGLISWLKSQSIAQIDLAVLTHAHGDHWGGFRPIVNAGIKIKEFRCYHPDSIRAGNAASREDSDNLLTLIRWLQARGTRVLFVDHGDTLQCGDVSWSIYRSQPKSAASDDPNAWGYINDGSLVLYSPELRGMLPGDGPGSQKAAIAYFKAKLGAKFILVWTDISHHGNSYSRSNAEAAKSAGCELAFESCVERDGPGTTEWTMYGARRLKQQGIEVWMQDKDIYIHAAEGRITFKQGDKTRTLAVPYGGKEVITGWTHDEKGWQYLNAAGSVLTGWQKLKWSGGIHWFCFGADGYMLTGWQYLKWSKGTNWFYFDAKNGNMRTGWQRLDKNGKEGWYLLDRTNGWMRHGWALDNGYWYLLDADGLMQTGWVTYKSRQCYLEPVAGKNKNQGHCYVSTTAMIDGKMYKFDDYGYATEITDTVKELDGCDVASYQAGIDFSAMTTTDFAIVKATQGTWYVNPYCDIQYSGAKAAGKLLGMYHYAEGADPAKEAQYFAKKVGSRVGECILALDWEGHDNSKFNSDGEVAWVLKFAMEVYRITGVHIFLYMSKSVTRRRNWSEVAKDVRLWCAQYANQARTDYKSNPWTDNAGFGAWKSDTIRQYSSKGRVTGYGGNLDINKAYMSRAEWLAAAAGKEAAQAEETAQPKTQWSAYVSMTTNPAKISNSGSDENGRYKGGKAGDQTGKEWRIRDWYNRPWDCVLRHPLAEVRACIATLAVKAAENDKIGYDQSQRDTYGQALAKADYDPSAITTAVESDCSKGVIDNTRAAGHILGIQELQNLSATYTGNMRAGYKAAGFYVLTESKYLSSSDYLLAGDILLNDQHHTCTVITNGAKSGDTVVMPLVKRGSTGAAVEQLQELLNAASYRNKKTLEEDGEFGPLTQAQVIHFQMDRGLEPDGEVGPITWAALIEATK